MQPPQNLDVINQHGGFTALTSAGTLWRPAAILKRGTAGTLQYFDEHSFYQTNDDVTRATYRVPGYGYPVIAWFDNQTGERIA